METLSEVYKTRHKVMITHFRLVTHFLFSLIGTVSCQLLSQLLSAVIVDTRSRFKRLFLRHHVSTASTTFLSSYKLKFDRTYGDFERSSRQVGYLPRTGDPEVKKRLNSVAAIAPPSSEEEGEHITAVWIRIQDHSCEEKQELKQKHIAYYGTNTLHCQEEL